MTHVQYMQSLERAKLNKLLVGKQIDAVDIVSWDGAEIERLVLTFSDGTKVGVAGWYNDNNNIQGVYVEKEP